MGLFSRSAAIRGVDRILKDWGAEETGIRMASRREQFLPYTPPGLTTTATV